MNIRIIPRLDIKGPNLVKGINLEGLRVLGKPEKFAAYYSKMGADELFYMDIVASLYERNNILDIVESTSSNTFIPLTVGGGLRSLEDIRDALHAGADKVALNTAVIRNPQLIKEAAERFGSSTIVISIEAKKYPDGHYEAYTDCGRERTNIEVIEWAQKVAKLGAGEIIVTSIDNEGTGKGYDCELTRKVSQAVSIPVIACGGAGKIDDIKNVILAGYADAVSLASMLHYDLIERDPNIITFKSETMSNGLSRFEKMSIVEIKNHLINNGISCRPYTEEFYE